MTMRDSGWGEWDVFDIDENIHKTKNQEMLIYHLIFIYS